MENNQKQIKVPRITFNAFNSQYSIIKTIAKQNFDWRVICQKDPWQPGVDWDIQWTDVAPPLEKFSKIKPYQKINHFPAMFQIARKNYLARNLKKMNKQFPEDYKFFPKTWLLPSEMNELKSVIQQKAGNKNKNLYIVKPECMSQGKGIFITKRVDQIDPNEHLVVQKYMKYPYLIDGLKFDLRIYVLVTNVQPLRIFIHQEGLARFASEQYKHKAYNNPFIHLTNYAINKDNANFTSDQSGETGHKRSLNAVFNTMLNNGIDMQALQEGIDDIIVKTLISIQPDLVHNYRTCQPGDLFSNMCFEILGFDIIIDSKGKPQLLEVNHAPSFNGDTNLDKLVKAQLLTDTFRLLNVTLQEKNLVLDYLKDQTEQRITGQNKLNKQQQQQQKNDMYQEKLKERDFYELNNLGSYRIIFPPMQKSDMQLIDEEKLKQYQQYLDYAKNYMMDIKISKNDEDDKQKQLQTSNTKSLKKLPKLNEDSAQQKLNTNNSKLNLNQKQLIRQAMMKSYEESPSTKQIQTQQVIQQKCLDNPQSPSNQVDSNIINEDYIRSSQQENDILSNFILKRSSLASLSSIDENQIIKLPMYQTEKDHNYINNSSISPEKLNITYSQQRNKSILNNSKTEVIKIKQINNQSEMVIKQNEYLDKYNQYQNEYQNRINQTQRTLQFIQKDSQQLRQNLQNSTSQVDLQLQDQKFKNIVVANSLQSTDRKTQKDQNTSSLHNINKQSSLQLQNINNIASSQRQVQLQSQLYQQPHLVITARQITSKRSRNIYDNSNSVGNYTNINKDISHNMVQGIINSKSIINLPYQRDVNNKNCQNERKHGNNHHIVSSQVLLTNQNYNQLNQMQVIKSKFNISTRDLSYQQLNNNSGINEFQPINIVGMERMIRMYNKYLSPQKKNFQQLHSSVLQGSQVNNTNSTINHDEKTILQNTNTNSQFQSLQKSRNAYNNNKNNNSRNSNNNLQQYKTQQDNSLRSNSLYSNIVGKHSKNISQHFEDLNVPKNLQQVYSKFFHLLPTQQQQQQPISKNQQNHSLENEDNNNSIDNNDTNININSIQQDNDTNFKDNTNNHKMNQIKIVKTKNIIKQKFDSSQNLKYQDNSNKDFKDFVNKNDEHNNNNNINISNYGSKTSKSQQIIYSNNNNNNIQNNFIDNQQVQEGLYNNVRKVISKLEQRNMNVISKLVPKSNFKHINSYLVNNHNKMANNLTNNKYQDANNSNNSFYFNIKSNSKQDINNK